MIKYTCAKKNIQKNLEVSIIICIFAASKDIFD